jgi:hypothetical protein
MEKTLEQYHQEVLTAAKSQKIEWLFPDAEVCRDAYEDDCDISDFIACSIEDARQCC